MVHYCSKLHQKIHWTGGECNGAAHKRLCKISTGNISSNSLSLLPAGASSRLLFLERSLAVVCEREEYEDMKASGGEFAGDAHAQQLLRQGIEEGAFIDPVEGNGVKIGSDDRKRDEEERDNNRNRTEQLAESILRKGDEDTTQTDLLLLSGRVDADTYLRAQDDDRADSASAAIGSTNNSDTTGNNNKNSNSNNKKSLSLIDHVFNKFMARVSRCKASQVLRYHRWPGLQQNSPDNEATVKHSARTSEGALRVSCNAYKLRNQLSASDVRSPEMAFYPSSGRSQCIAPCSYCGGARKFEFQVSGLSFYMLKICY